MAAGGPEPAGEGAVDRSVTVTVPERLAEQAGAALMDVLGPFEERKSGDSIELVFYPPIGGPSTREELLSLLPPAFAEPGAFRVEAGDVSRDWVEGWREHFRPIVVGAVRIRPPWEAAAQDTGAGLVDVVINPGLGFGTGLHPTTRGTLLLLQEGLRTAGGSALGRLVDVGTGSGILAVAAAKLGWAPVIAMDNDPVALVSARENVAANGVEAEVRIEEKDAGHIDVQALRDATVLANMTLEPVTVLLRRLAGGRARPRRIVVSGILAGVQEEQLVLAAHESGLAPARRIYEGEWVSLELLPEGSGA